MVIKEIFFVLLRPGTTVEKILENEQPWKEIIFIPVLLALVLGGNFYIEEGLTAFFKGIILGTMGVIAFIGISHGFSKLLGGKANLQETFACMSLSMSPLLLISPAVLGLGHFMANSTKAMYTATIVWAGAYFFGFMYTLLITAVSLSHIQQFETYRAFFLLFGALMATGIIETVGIILLW